MIAAWPHCSSGRGVRESACQLTRYAAKRYDSDERCDIDAWLAKLFASEVAMKVALTALGHVKVRLCSRYGYQPAPSGATRLPWSRPSTPAPTRRRRRRRRSGAARPDRRRNEFQRLWRVSATKIGHVRAHALS
jgi:alkylation response protein AidB-like acyl-CoA dehydrogenase